MNCNQQYFPIGIQSINNSNVSPGDIVEIDYVYSDGIESNITIDANYDPLQVSNLTNILAFNSLISASLSSSFQNYQETSTIPSADELTLFWLITRDVCFNDNDYLLKTLPQRITAFLLNKLNTVLYNAQINENLLSSYGIRNGICISPNTIYDLIALLHRCNLISIPLYDGLSSIDLFLPFDITFTCSSTIDIILKTTGPLAPNANDQVLIRSTMHEDGKIVIAYDYHDFGQIPMSSSLTAYNPKLLSDPACEDGFVTKCINMVSDSVANYYDFIRPIRYTIAPSEYFSNNPVDFFVNVTKLAGSIIAQMRVGTISVANLTTKIIYELNNKTHNVYIKNYGSVVSPNALTFGGYFGTNNRLQIELLLDTLVKYGILPGVSAQIPSDTIIDAPLLNSNFFLTYESNVLTLIQNSSLNVPTRTLPVIPSNVDEEILRIKLLLYTFSQGASFKINLSEFKQILSEEEKTIVDEYFIRDFIEMMMVKFVITAVSSTSVHFSFIDWIDSYEGFEFDKLSFYWNLSFVDVLNIISSNISLLNISSVLGNNLSNFELPGRFEIQKLTSYIKRFQNSNYSEDDLPVYELWNIVSDQEFCSFGELNNAKQVAVVNDQHLVNTGKFGKLVVQILSSSYRADLAHITDPHIWKNRTSLLNFFPYNTPNSSSYKALITQWNSIFRSLPVTDPIRTTMDPNSTTNGGVFRTTGLISGSAIQIGGQTPFGVNDRNEFVFSHSYKAQLCGLTSSFGGNFISESFFLPNSGSFIINTGSQYTMISFRPLFQVSYDGKILVDYINFTASNANSAIGSTDINAFERNLRFSNYYGAPYDGYQSVVYRIRKWPIILNSNQQDITISLLKNYNRYIHNLALIPYTSSIKESYFIDDKNAGLPSYTIDEVFTDLQGNNIEISSSFNVHRASAFNATHSLYVGGIYVNRPLQTFSYINYKKYQFKQIQPTGSGWIFTNNSQQYAHAGYKINFKDYTNIIPQSFVIDILENNWCLIDSRIDSAEHVFINELMQHYNPQENGNIAILCNPVFYSYIYHLANGFKQIPNNTGINSQTFLNVKNQLTQFPVPVMGAEQIKVFNQANYLTYESSSLLLAPFWNPTERKISVRNFDEKSSTFGSI